MFIEKDIENLKNSIKTQGQINPIKIRQKDDRYQVIAGWRRIQALSELDYDRIQAHVYADLNDEEALRLNIADNMHHVDLDEVEIAYLVRHLRDEKGLTVEQIAVIMHFNSQRVYNLLVLTELESEIQEKVAEGSLSLSHVVELSRFPASKRLEYMWRAVEDGWPVRRLKTERRKYTHPFIGRWTDDDIQKYRGKWHAVRFRRSLSVDRRFEIVWKLMQFKNMPTSFNCEFTTTIPAKNADPKYVCPNDVEWVVLNPNQKRKPPVERDAWFFFCRFCAEKTFPGIQFHDLDWNPPFDRVLDTQESPKKNEKEINDLKGYNYMIYEY